MLMFTVWYHASPITLTDIVARAIIHIIVGKRWYDRDEDF